MKNYQMGIDISKEKLNICLRKGTHTVREEETLDLQRGCLRTRNARAKIVNLREILIESL